MPFTFKVAIFISRILPANRGGRDRNLVAAAPR